MWYVTLDQGLQTRDMWEKMKILSKFQLPSSYGLGVSGDMWQLTFDTLHLTSDIWPMTHNICHVTHIVLKFEVPSSNGLGLKESIDMGFDIDCWFLFVSHAKNYWNIWRWWFVRYNALFWYVSCEPQASPSSPRCLICHLGGLRYCTDL